MTDRPSTGRGGGTRAGVARAYLTLTAGGAHTGAAELGTLKLLLRGDVVPRTVSNFTTLLGRPSPRGYRGCPFHRLIEGFMIQGGDFTEGDGTGGASIYGKTFEDENFALGHDSRGTLSMANSGPNTNGSQFFVNFRATPHLDGRHVVFGTVDMGDKESAGVLEKLEAMRVDGDDRPLVEVRISDCGVVEEEKAGGGGETTAASDAGPVEAGGDDDEIDLDDDDDDDDGDGDGPKKDVPAAGDPAAAAAAEDDDDEIDLDEDEIDNPSAPSSDDPTASDGSSSKKLSKKDALRARLRSLKTRMNQSRALNRREVRSEGERLGSEEGVKRERRRLKKEDRDRRGREWEESNGRALGNNVGASTGGGGGGGGGNGNATMIRGGEKKYMAESADSSLRRASRRAEKTRANRYEANDYYNPEGQHRNYERGLRSVSAASTAAASASAGASSTYDPLNFDHRHLRSESSLSKERAGAARLASELRRRHERADKRKRDAEEFDAADVSGINQRNKRFNEKIGRNFDRHTAEIRQNLERGTAL